MDRGANGGLAGSDMRVIYKPHRKINISGIDNHEVTGLDVATAATLLNTSLGKVIGIFNEYAYLGKGSSIHSSGQLEWFKTLVDEKSIKVGGTQLITTLDGYSIPLLIRDGLAYATSLGRPTDQDMDTYPHVFFTSPDEWDPSVLDHDPPHLDGLNPSQVSDQHFGDPMFDAYGDFNEHIIANLNILLDAPPGDCGPHTAISSVSTVNLHQSSPQEPDWDALRPFFAWTSPSSIKDTFNVTTRHGTAPHTQDYIKKHFKSRNPVFNIPRRSAAVATDTIFSDTPAVDDGSTTAQFFCGRDTLVCDAYGIKSTKQFINTLSDNIRKRGAMDTLISDGGKYEISKIIIRSGVRSALRTTITCILHHLQGRGPHFLFPFLIHNNLKILCHLTLLMHQPPILSNLSKVRLVKMKLIQSPWPTLTSPISLADPSFSHLKIMGSATWPKSLTLMTMDRLLKTLNSS